MARQLCKNKNMTITTRTIASAKVLITPFTDASTNGVLSRGYATFNPDGIEPVKRVTSAFTLSAVSKALAPEAS
ncbi:Uncharacterised protein [Acinetobacter baumannii]|nr:Uncharacterised protein [Acinetobacter baumannii]